MNDTFRIALRAMVMAAMTLLTVSTATAQDTPTGPRVHGNVYGGGNLATVGGSVTVNMSAGTVEKDVYGGGALANTNINNATNYGTESETVSSTSTNTTTVNLTGGTIMGDAYGGGLGRIEVTAVAGEKYTQEEINAAQEGDPAYGKTTDEWKVEPVEGVEGVEATVYGDISVNLGSSTSGSSATAFYLSNYEGDYSSVAKSGRIFGCNNLNGSPRGNVTVTVYGTVRSKDSEGNDIARTVITRNDNGEITDVATSHQYDVAAVYGGGNLAGYTTTGKKASVRIWTCEASVHSVYGGGNAAAVPETYVLVRGAYEIEEVFGGGNGKDSYTIDGGTQWETNPGANVNGNATTLLTGGFIHEAYGGSNSKGTISGNVSIDKSSGGDCTLRVDDLYGAGKDADIEGDLIMVMGCSQTRTENIYGCSKNANVKGNVELTITSGEYGKVFGGNNQSGAIFGHIIVNIEEVGCSPIIIDELYLGGNDAAYSVYGYYKAKKYAKTESGEEKLFLDYGMTIPLYKDDSNNLYKDEAKTIPLYKDEDDFLYIDQEKTRCLYMPRTSANDPNDIVVFSEHPHTVLDETKTHYDDPEVNIISCTSIGQVFGGGLGTGATLYGNPKVNINMIKGAFGDSAPASGNPDKLGAIGTVYGGGNAADIVGNTMINIGTSSTVDKIVWNNMADKPEYESDGTTLSTTLENVVGAYITGNVFGGGKGEAKLEAGTAGEAFLCAKAMVKGDVGTHVNIGNGLVTGSVYGGGEKGRVEHNTEVKIGLDEADVPTGKTSAPIINGNVFGAGKGVNTHGYSALVRGTSTVTVQADAKVRGSIYGGGEMASVGKYKVENGLPVALAPDNIHPNSGYCYVTIRGNAEIGPDDMEMTKEGGPSDAGHVFGAGKGVLPYENADEEPFHMNGTQVVDENNEWDGKSWEDHPTRYPAYNPNAELDDNYVKFIKSLALATQTVVVIEGNPFIKGSVYGGSENGFVQQDTHVTISGGQIGNGYVQMDDDGKYLANKGSVNRRYTNDEWAAGHLITTGDDALTSLVGTNYKSSLPECASWPYGQAANEAGGYAPYDKFANKSGELGQYDNGKSTEGGRFVGDDGHTFFGNVFGGGSGYYPYKAGRWFKDAGAVYGDTYVTIKGGHILTSVYGGNEMTDVGKYDDSDRLKLQSGGNCYVTMIGGTLGVPRTLGQIDKHPVTCYLFGAGKGDQRVFFNKSTNVGNVFVHISDDARIYGSIFGGGEDGHVMKNVTMNIGGSTLPTAVSDNSVLSSVFTGVTLSGSKTVSEVDYPYIGTWGTSYVDGNVFGAGRGFGGDAYTAGNVAGSVTMNISGGTMLGSVYGGGRLGSVGYGLFDAKTSTGGDMPGYGEMRPDNTTETESGNSESLDSFNRGHVDITINGGTIGNKWEFVDVDPSTTPANLATWKTNHNVPNTEYEEPKVVTTDNKTSYYYQLKHTKGGNVFAGGMGRQKQIDGQTLIDPEKIDWKKLGNVKQTTLTITGGKIMSNVYGGGELGAVVPYVNGNTVEGGTTQININGTAVIGTLIERSVTTTDEGGSDVTTKVPVYTFGSVYGGGMGNETDKTSSDDEARIGGLVKGSTTITMSAGEVKGSVYGGGEMAVVQGNHTTTDSKTVGTEVSISGGTIGYKQDGFGGATMGNVYGGGKGSLTTANAGLIKNNTLVKITGTPTIYHNIYGGGAYGSVGTFNFTTSIPENWTDGTGKAEVIVEGGTIGINGHENGMVFGSSRGDVAAPTGSPAVDPNDRLAWVYDTHVVIGNSSSSGGPSIKGTVYGSGENGHTFNNTLVDVNKGTIGIETGEDITYTENGKPFTKGGAAYPYRGNVYGGGCGTDTYPVTVTEGEGQSAVTKTIQAFNPLAGIVLGDATVNINGGKVVRNVYGAGAMGSVGKTTWTTTTTTEGGVTTTTKSATTSGGLTTVNVKGGTIGVSGTVGDGNVFGAARGSKDVVQADRDDIARVSVTNVEVSGGIVMGNVYGGGELGDVGTIVKNTSDYNYTWQKTGGGDNTPSNNGITGTNTNTGICNVTIIGGTIGSTTAGGNVFGGGKGDANTWWCEKAIAFATNVSISKGSDAENAPVVYGTVYGGGEIGRVEDDTKVIIGTADGGDEPDIKGNVFGAGKGMATRGYSALVRGNSIVTVQGSAKVGGNVFGGGEEASLGRFNLDKGLPKSPASGGSSEVTIQGNANIGSSGTGNHVYGAGQGVEPAFDSSNYKNFKSMQLYDNRPKGEKDVKGTYWDYYINDDGNEDRRFVWVYYTTEPEYQAFLNTLALASHPTVNIAENAIVYGDVYGGGQRGITLGDVAVNITGGTVMNDVYGGGSLADTNKGNWDDSQYVEVTGLPVGHTLTDLFTRTGGSGTTDSPYTYAATASGAEAAANATYYSKGTWATGKYDETTHATSYKTNVTLTGGTIKGNVYGGGLGQIGREASAAVGTEGDTNYTPAVTKLDEVKAKVYGDVLVTLNGTKTAVTTGTGENATTTDVYNDDCVVEGNIFGCNNQNGSPQSAVTVHVYKTQGWDGHTGTAQDKLDSETAADHSYHVKGVYGGGNLSAFYPDLKATRDTVQAYVIIDGCKMTSIKQVYGGGNAASAPATNITINATYEIEEVFGGGNGLDDITIHGATMTNPGANVGYEGYPTSYDIPASSKEERTAKFSYGSGKASVTIYDGKIHRVFGGSNNKGNVRESAVTLLDDMSGCDFQVDEAYGGGKNAPMDAEAKLLMACIPGLKVAYGGAQEADVLGGVNMTITNGTYERVFGGNNISGTIQGPIVVNVEETGCRPIIIGELYGGGNKAGYSVYGYGGDDGRTPIEPSENVTRKWDDPQVNVKSFTSIGNVYGGGYGETATMVANPTVNINVAEGKYSNQTSDNYFTGFTYDATNKRYSKVIGGNTVYVPAHKENTIGAIYNVFGGGNAAKVIGNPNVNIGTRKGADEYMAVVDVPTTTVTTADGYYTRSGEGTATSPYVYTPFEGTPSAGTTYYKKYTIKGADIRGNVYGGGNNADVTGNTNVVIGKKAE